MIENNNVNISVPRYSSVQNEEQTTKETVKEKPETDRESVRSWMPRGKIFKGERD